MGAVYLGYNEKDSQQVAIKVLSDQLASNQGFIDRFYRKSGFRQVRVEVAQAMTAKQAGGGLTRYYFEKDLWVGMSYIGQEASRLPSAGKKYL